METESSISATLVTPPYPEVSAESLRGSGALLMSEHSIPESDAIVRQRGNELIQVELQYLEDHLRFLELVCWYDELLVGELPFIVKLDPDRLDREVVRASNKYAAHSGDADLRVRTITELQKRGVLNRRCVVPTEDMITPDVYIRRLIESSSEYRTQIHFEGNIKDWSDVEFEEQLVWYSRHHGIPYALGEFAKHAGILARVPDASHNVDLKSLDGMESSISTNVWAKLLDRLTQGARKEVEALESLGVPLHLPPSPIASWIIQEANSKEDFLKVAMQIRDRIKDTRDHVIGLQREMMDQTLAVKTRLSRAREIKRVMRRLDPSAEIDIKSEIRSYSSLVESIKETVLGEDGFSVDKATDIILSKPIEWIVDRFRNRKYRLLFDIKKRFLADRSYHSKVCEIFGFRLGDPGVQISNTYCSHSVINSWNRIGMRNRESRKSQHGD